MRNKKLANVLLAAALMTGLVGCAPKPPSESATEAPHGKGDPVALNDLPQAVVDGVQKEMPGAVLVKARKLPDGNYRLSDVKLGKQEYDLTVSPDGSFRAFTNGISFCTPSTTACGRSFRATGSPLPCGTRRRFTRLPVHTPVINAAARRTFASFLFHIVFPSQKNLGQAEVNVRPRVKDE